MRHRPDVKKAIRVPLNLSIGAALLGAGFVVPAISQEAGNFLENVKKGEWTVRFRDGSGARKLCLRSGTELTQLRQKNSGCERLIVDEDADSVTVHHACKNRGYSRTSVRKETRNLLQIESQGFFDQQPFQYSAEARWTGPCK